ncbi:hypothetical protein M9458_031917, partial [Cirrhinus mrigala]
WSSCSSTCSNGTMQRTRECNGPSYGGLEQETASFESVLWMANGSSGALGLVAPKHVVEEASKDKGRAQGRERKLDVAMRRDAQ